VFLLSRIHEAYNEGDAPRASVIHGMARIGKVILFAGLIMAAVFLAFVTLVTLLGDRAWSLPRWLDRLLPNVSLEGHLVQGLDEKEADRAKVPA
jgi:RND superfamily putative drug exporter